MMKYEIHVTTVYQIEAEDLDELHEKWQRDGLSEVLSNRTEVYDEDGEIVD